MSGQLVFLIAIGALFYFMLVLPQRRKARQQQELQRRLQPGVEVMTTAGLFGVVQSVTDDEIRIEVAPGVVQRYAKGAVMRVVTPEEPEDLDQLSPGTDDAGEASSEDGSSDPPAAPREP